MEPRSEAGRDVAQEPRSEAGRTDELRAVLDRALDEAHNLALDAVVEAVGRERLTDNTGQPDDEAYNRALDDVLRIIEEARRG